MKLFRTNTGEWIANSDGTRKDILELSDMLSAMSHEGVGKEKTLADGTKKPFTLIFNDAKILIRTHMELWMFAQGLAQASNTYIAKLFDDNIVKVINKLKEDENNIADGDIKNQKH